MVADIYLASLGVLWSIKNAVGIEGDIRHIPPSRCHRYWRIPQGNARFQSDWLGYKRIEPHIPFSHLPRLRKQAIPSGVVEWTDRRADRVGGPGFRLLFLHIGSCLGTSFALILPISSPLFPCLMWLKAPVATALSPLKEDHTDPGQLSRGISFLGKAIKTKGKLPAYLLRGRCQSSLPELLLGQKSASENSTGSLVFEARGHCWENRQAKKMKDYLLIEQLGAM